MTCSVHFVYINANAMYIEENVGWYKTMFIRLSKNKNGKKSVKVQQYVYKSFFTQDS